MSLGCELLGYVEVVFLSAREAISERVEIQRQNLAVPFLDFEAIAVLIEAEESLLKNIVDERGHVSNQNTGSTVFRDGFVMTQHSEP